MKSAIFSSFLLLLIVQSIVPVYNLTCYTCNSTNGETCKHEKTVCPDGHKCITISQETGSHGKVIKTIAKHCARNMPCEYMHGYSEGVFVRFLPKCCTGDLCNEGFYELPKDETKEKGPACPFCTAYDTVDGCNATRSTICNREDDLCAEFRGELEGPDGVPFNISAQGCSSPSACKYDYTQAANLKLVLSKVNKCYTPKDPTKK